MRAALLTAAAGLAAFSLSACNNDNRTGVAGGGSNSVCKPFTTAAAQPAANPAAPPTAINAVPGAVPAAPVADPSAPLDECLHRWGYTLAASSDPANLVAAATVSACSDLLANWNREGMGAANAGGAVEAPSLLTGEQTNPMAEHHAFAEQRALFYVVQARAGHCAAPPLANGQPKG